MFRRPTRKAAGWFAMVALALSLAQPTQARPGAFDPAGFDRCVGGKLVHGAPAGIPAPTAHDCDLCGGSATAAPGPVGARPPAIASASEKSEPPAVEAPRLARVDLARARAPPAA